MQWPQICRLAFAVVLSSWAGNFLACSRLSGIGDEQRKEVSERKMREDKGKEGKRSLPNFFSCSPFFFCSSPTTNWNRLGTSLSVYNKNV